MESTNQMVETDIESLFEEMAVPETEEAFAGHSCLCFAADPDAE